MQRFQVVYHGISHELHEFSQKTHGEVYQENTSNSWNIPWFTMQEHFISILYHAIQNTMATELNQCDIRSAYDEKVGCNADKYTNKTFLYSG